MVESQCLVFHLFEPPEKEPVESQTAVLSLSALGGFGAADPGHEGEGGETNEPSTGRAMKSEMRGRMDLNDEEEEDGEGRCALYK